MIQEKLRALHSRYNPQAEAERYVESLSLNENIRFFILIEPGLGYMAAPLRKKAGGAKVIALHVEDNPEAKTAEAIDSEWYPGRGVSVQDFLGREISDSLAAEIRLLEWRPAMTAYGQAYLALVEETAAFIKRTDANTRTLKTFGQRWFRNFLKNLTYIRKVLYPVHFSAPLLVTGAGPSLEETIPKIKKSCDSVFTLAVSSSVAALKAQELIPDMVINTDGTQWAKFHLHEIFRGAGSGYTLAVSLISAFPSQCENFPLLIISDGSFWQTLILKELGIPFIVLPQRGTVTATALDLAFALTDNNIYFAGMDLASRDIQSHERPYSFDRLIEERAGRFSPAYSETYKRSSLLKSGGSYDIYASWFKNQLAFYPKRLHSLGNNNPLFNPIETGGIFRQTPEGRGFTEEISKNLAILNFERRDNIAQTACVILEKALLEDCQNSISAKLKEELKLLIKPERASVSTEELISAIRLTAGLSGE